MVKRNIFFYFIIIISYSALKGMNPPILPGLTYLQAVINQQLLIKINNQNRVNTLASKVKLLSSLYAPFLSNDQTAEVFFRTLEQGINDYNLDSGITVELLEKSYQNLFYYISVAIHQKQQSLAKTLATLKVIPIENPLASSSAMLTNLPSYTLDPSTTSMSQLSIPMHTPNFTTQNYTESVSSSSSLTSSTHKATTNTVIQTPDNFLKSNSLSQDQYKRRDEQHLEASKTPVRKPILPKVDLRKCRVPNCTTTFEGTSAKEIVQLGLFEHLKNVHNLCPFCGYEQKNTKELLTHIINKHENQKSYGCQLCPTVVRRCSYLIHHYRGHQLEKSLPYGNKKTGQVKQFNQKVDLYQCPVQNCSMTYKGNNHSAKEVVEKWRFNHLQTEHALCPFCDYEQKDKNIKKLREHITQEHEKKLSYSCQLCPRTDIKFLSNLTKHYCSHSNIYLPYGKIEGTLPNSTGSSTSVQRPKKDNQQQYKKRKHTIIEEDKPSFSSQPQKHSRTTDLSNSSSSVSEKSASSSAYSEGSTPSLSSLTLPALPNLPSIFSSSSQSTDNTSNLLSSQNTLSLEYLETPQVEYENGDFASWLTR